MHIMIIIAGIANFNIS